MQVLRSLDDLSLREHADVEGRELCLRLGDSIVKLPEAALKRCVQPSEAGNIQAPLLIEGIELVRLGERLFLIRLE